MATMGIPSQIKTANVPAYVSNKMKQFFAYYNIKYVKNLPHNERFIKQRGRVKLSRDRLNHALLTLNFPNVGKKKKGNKQQLRDIGLPKNWGTRSRWEHGCGYAYESTGNEKIWILFHKRSDQ